MIKKLFIKICSNYARLELSSQNFNKPSNQIKNITTYFIIIITILYGCAENNIDQKLYMGQMPPTDSAIVFAPGIVTTDQHEHSRIVFSKDNSRIIWAVIPIDPVLKSKGESPYLTDNQNIWFSVFENMKWSKPAILDFTKSSGGKAPAFSSDGNKLFYQTNKITADPEIRPKPVQWWSVEYNNSGWGQPTKISSFLPSEDRKVTMSYCFAENGNIYFDFGGPDENGNWRWGIYMAQCKEGNFLPHISLGNRINQGRINWCPWVAPDESYLIFSSHRDDGYGNGDLYISFNINNEWTEPVNMGPKINTANQERFPSVSPDGKYLFFARHEEETFNDFYWINTGIIENIKNNLGSE